MKTLYFVTVLCLVTSFIIDRQKTYKALMIAVKKIKKILPSFIILLIMVSILLYVLPEHLIAKYLGIDNKWLAVFVSALLGSISVIPGFIAFPLSGLLQKQGIPYMVLASFTTTLMMVGVLSYPVERIYLGTKTTLIRNAFSLLLALIVSLCIGLIYGEVILW